MPDSQNPSSTDSQQQDSSQQNDDTSQRSEEGPSSMTDWFAMTAVRAGLSLIGVILLLFALGQAVGLPILELATEAITSQTGQWLLVAFFAILLIGVAQKAPIPS